MFNCTTQKVMGRAMRSTAKRTHGGAALSVIFIIALLALAAYFYMRALSSNAHHDVQASAEVASPVLVQETQTASDDAAQPAPDPRLVKGLDSIINPVASPVALSGSPLPVPQTQVDLIKQVFAPELLK